MASMRDIKRRKESVQSTEQITKAMKLVSTVKLQRAKTRAEDTRPYFEHMYHSVHAILKKSENQRHPYLDGGISEKTGIIVVTSNRGLAGGYNSNIVKMVLNSGIAKEDAVIYAVGRKGRDALARRGYTIAEDYSDAMNEPAFADATAIGRRVLDDFANGVIGQAVLLYTDFKNTVTHLPKQLKLLPVLAQEEDDGADDMTVMEYEPEAEEVLELIIPKYMNSLIYGGLIQSFASENGARMQAMDAAASNADEMMSELELKYNRARQSAITQELTEIIAGANAIE